eukprot:GSMAST32.ASY1.ANO1.1546.1 assembled CDS
MAYTVARRGFCSARTLLKDNLCLTFPGQGTQYYGMGKQLCHDFPFARSIFEQADEALQYNLSRLMFSSPTDNNDDQSTCLSQTEHAQPAILIHSIATLAILREECGLNLTFDSGVDSAVSVVLGHSLGEYTALVASGSLSLSEGVQLVRSRGLAMSNAVPNEIKTLMSAMMPTTRNAVSELIQEVSKNLGEGHVCNIANVNSRKQVVISGTKAAVELIAKLAKERKICFIPLKVSSAFHSDLMAPAVEELKLALSNVSIKTPTIPIIFNVDALEQYTDDVVKKLLLRQMVSPVLWLDSMYVLFFF